MKDADPFPITPDFDHWPIKALPTSISVENGALTLEWSKGRIARYHPFLLAENDPSHETLHPISRETTLSPLDLPADLQVASARMDDGGAIVVEWSHGRCPSRFHPGWLYGNACFPEAPEKPTEVLWTAEALSEPPSFDGPLALRDPEMFLAWLTALRDYGVSRLENLPVEDGILMRMIERIGAIRDSNFGRMYTLAIKDNPDSNAFTSDALPPHIDMPTRECPHGLQFLFCRENTTRGGEGIYADAYRIAYDLHEEDPLHYAALCEIPWTYNNRSKTSSFKATGPVIERGPDKRITGIRYNTWLRAPMVAALDDQDRAYRSYRAFAARAQDPRYQMKFAYRPGDLLAFDNRRVLHGRSGYDAHGGTRLIEGMYSDRDDLHSAIRTLERTLTKEDTQ